MFNINFCDRDDIIGPLELIMHSNSDFFLNFSEQLLFPEIPDAQMYIS